MATDMDHINFGQVAKIYAKAREDIPIYLRRATKSRVFLCYYFIM